MPDRRYDPSRSNSSPPGPLSPRPARGPSASRDPRVTRERGSLGGADAIGWPTPADVGEAAGPLMLGEQARPAETDSWRLPRRSESGPVRCALTIDVEDWFDGLD